MKKAILNNVKGNLTVLVEERESGKGYVDYFLNGVLVTNWSELPEYIQGEFAIIADVICEQSGLIKWSY